MTTYPRPISDAHTAVTYDAGTAPSVDAGTTPYVDAVRVFERILLETNSARRALRMAGVPCYVSLMLGGVCLESGLLSDEQLCIYREIHDTILRILSPYATSNGYVDTPQSNCWVYYIEGWHINWGTVQ